MPRDRITAAKYRQLFGQPMNPKRGRNNAVKTEFAGIQFDSLTECERYKYLLALQQAGEITGLLDHPSFSLEVNGFPLGDFTPDFGYWRKGEYVLEDVKGAHSCREVGLKCRLLFALHGARVRIVRWDKKKCAWTSRLASGLGGKKCRKS